MPELPATRTALRLAAAAGLDQMLGPLLLAGQGFEHLCAAQKLYRPGQPAGGDPGEPAAAPPRRLRIAYFPALRAASPPARRPGVSPSAAPETGSPAAFPRPAPRTS